MNCRALMLMAMAIATLAIHALAGELKIDAAFPGGNLLVDGMEGDVVRVRQDRRDTPRFWFHWSFRVRGAAGRTLTFQFEDGHVFGTQGPAVRVNDEPWRWLGRGGLVANAFRFSFPTDAREAHFSFAIPYLEEDLRRFLDAHANLRVETLTRSEHGRPIELLRCGATPGPGQPAVLIVCRHHACESAANFVAEGLMEAVLADDRLGRSLRESIAFTCIPFMDKDGVEEGDQGKARAPHDHWLDYRGDSKYAAVRALKALYAGGEHCDLALDLHCPYLSDDRVFFALGSDVRVAAGVDRLARILQSTRAGEVRYDAADNLPFGASWNRRGEYGELHNFVDWAEQLRGMTAAGTFEVPYASVRGVATTPANLRSLGRDLAQAIDCYFRRDGASMFHIHGPATTAREARSK
jgi:hypothetical protein